MTAHCCWFCSIGSLPHHRVKGWTQLLLLSSPRAPYLFALTREGRGCVAALHGRTEDHKQTSTPVRASISGLVHEHCPATTLAGTQDNDDSEARTLLSHTLREGRSKTTAVARFMPESAQYCGFKRGSRLVAHFCPLKSNPLTESG
jgi:hypothetical protein